MPESILRLMTEQNSVVVEETFESVRTFVEALIPALYADDGPPDGSSSDPVGRMIFRGHADDDFSLTPSALRPDSGALSKFGLELGSSNKWQFE